jgi:hypothetical protein
MTTPSVGDRIRLTRNVGTRREGETATVTVTDLHGWSVGVRFDTNAGPAARFALTVSEYELLP